MTATNHALTGACIGLIVGQPLIAIPAAFLSHFICDALPHFGGDGNKKWIKSKLFKQVLVVDAALCVVLVGVLASLRPDHWLLACICAFVATSPDLWWINLFIKVNSKKSWEPSLFSRFASGIQWFQKPIGAVVEVSWLASGIIIIGIMAH